MPFDSAPQQKPRITMEQVRARYPNPSSSLAIGCSIIEPRYCVGGAFCLYVGGGLGLHMPGTRILADELRHHNPALTETNSRYLARAITSANDCFEFETAWDFLGVALSTFKPIKIPVPPLPDPETIFAWWLPCL